MGTTEHQISPSDKFPISLDMATEEAYLVIHMPMQGFRCGQFIDFTFYKGSELRLILHLRTKNDPPKCVDFLTKTCFLPPGQWYGSPNAVWMVKISSKIHVLNCTFYYSFSTDGQQFMSEILGYDSKRVSDGSDPPRGIDAITYDYAGYDVARGRAVTDAEKTATVAIFKGPIAKFEAQSYFAKQIDHEVPFLALKDIEGRERALEEREKLLHAREVSLDQKEGILPQGGGTQPPQAKPASDIRPSDYDSIKVSATKAWPGIIKEVFGRDSLTEWMEEYHDFMRKWVEERGDDLPSTAYDYLVYAHRVAWPQILLQHTSDEEFVKVREKHAAFMRVLI